MEGRIALCLSGGMDSVWALWTLAAKTDIPITAHHVAMRGASNWGRAELQAFHASVDWVEANLRPVPRIVTGLGADDITAFVRRPTLAVMAVAARCAGDGFGAGDWIYTGRNSEDDVSQALAAPIRPEESTREIDLTAGRQQMVDLLFESRDRRPSVTSVTPAPGRAQMVDELPHPLLDTISSCSDPAMVDGRWTPCGSSAPFRFPYDAINRCRKCQIIAPHLDKYKPERGWRARLAGAPRT